MAGYPKLKEAAQYAISLLRADPQNWTAVATQFVKEKGWTWWENPQPGYNVGNVTKGGSENGFEDYDSLDAGVQGYVATLKNGCYNNVLHAVRDQGPEDVLQALSDSPWCSPPYSLTNLREIMQTVESRIDGTTVPEESAPRIEEKGDSGPDVRELQAALNKVHNAGLTVDGIYGPKTMDAVKSFQKDVGITVDGVAGPETEAALKAVTGTAKPAAPTHIRVEATAPLNTLWGIAAKYLGDGAEWPRLLKLNPNVNPRDLHVGDLIRVR